MPRPDSLICCLIPLYLLIVDATISSISGNSFQSHASSSSVPKDFSLAPFTSDGLLPTPKGHSDNQQYGNNGYERGKGRGRGSGNNRPHCLLCGKFSHLVHRFYHRFIVNFTWVTGPTLNNQNNPSPNLVSYDSDSLTAPQQLQQTPHPSQNHPQVYHSPHMQVSSLYHGIHPPIVINPQPILSANSYYAFPKVPTSAHVNRTFVYPYMCSPHPHVSPTQAYDPFTTITP